MGISHAELLYERNKAILEPITKEINRRLISDWVDENSRILVKVHLPKNFLEILAMCYPDWRVSLSGDALEFKLKRDLSRIDYDDRS